MARFTLQQIIQKYPIITTGRTSKTGKQMIQLEHRDWVELKKIASNLEFIETRCQYAPEIHKYWVGLKEVAK